MTIYKPSGDIIIDVPVTKSAVEKYELMGDHYIQLPFEYAEVLDIPVGSFIRSDDNVAFFTMNVIFPERLSNKDGYKYDIRFYAPQHRMKRRVLAWLSASRKETTFNLTTTIEAYAQLIVDNMNEHDEIYSWQLGNIPTTEATKKIEFNGVTCWDAVVEIAKVFECEWWVEMDKNLYPTLCFGKLAKGEYEEWREGEVVKSFPAFKGDDSTYGTRFFIYGGTRNIPSDYYESALGGTTNHISEKRLHLPNGQEYIDVRQDLTEAEVIEKVVNLDEIFPKNEDVVTGVRTRVDTASDGETQTTFYIIDCAESPFVPTDDTIIEEHIYAKFTSGSLMGREFELTGYKKGLNFEYSYELMAQTESNGEDGVIVIPNEFLHPEVGDAFILTGVLLPRARIVEAEQELLAKGTEYVVEHSSDTNIYDCPTNPVYCQLNDKNYILGQRVSLIGGAFGDGGRASRIQGYEKKLWNPYEATYSVGDNRRYTRLGAIRDNLNNFTTAVLTPLKAVTESNSSQSIRAERYALQAQTTAIQAQTQSEKLSNTVGDIESGKGELYSLHKRVLALEEAETASGGLSSVAIVPDSDNDALFVAFAQQSPSDGRQTLTYLVNTVAYDGTAEGILPASVIRAKIASAVQASTQAANKATTALNTANNALAKSIVPVVIEVTPTNNNTSVVLEADTATIVKGAPITSNITITAINQPQNSGFDNKWILRLAYVVSGIRITFPSGVTLNWKDGNALAQTTALGTYEITIRRGNLDGGYYIAEWSFFPR